MSTELHQPFSAEYLLLHSHTSNNCTCFCFLQACIFNRAFSNISTSNISAINKIINAQTEQSFSWVFSPPQRRNKLLIVLLLDADRLLAWLEVRKIPGSNCNWNSFPLIVVLSCWTICYNLHSPFSQEKSQTCCYNSTARTDSLWVRWLLALLL